MDAANWALSDLNKSRLQRGLALISKLVVRFRLAMVEEKVRVKANISRTDWGTWDGIRDIMQRVLKEFRSLGAKQVNSGVLMNQRNGKTARFY
jgi:hypothetical protein